MAQFTAQGRLKHLFRGETVSVGVVLDTKDLKSQYKVGGGVKCMVDSHSTCPHNHRRTLKFLPSTALFSSSFLKKSVRSSAEARSTVGVDDAFHGYDGVDELENDELSCFRGLVLDISYRPVNVVCWRRAICLEFMEKADVLEYYDQTVNSPSGLFYIPAVLRVPHLLQVVKRRRIRNTLTRKNIFYRDNFTCQYCSSSHNLTIDHLLPIARGGNWIWENLAPKDYDILAIPLTTAAIKLLRMRKGTPQEWNQYLQRQS
ncbi:uncharacterized protein LOC131167884 isoform X2 [Malania oleifera]|uniref:uncharacterized protein LOC131167884 isoform X2 n=1 Tax=Malania oleifera TaxID=397392 RepID=UPI0025AE135D|nr:uncharacterized protein LOC131167884 isoform X2 [Malania oleifera]